MSVSLSKGGSVSLTKEAPTSPVFKIGLGWNPRTHTSDVLDACAVVVRDNQALGDEYFVSYETPITPEGAVEHWSTHLPATGEDDEMIVVDTTKVPLEADRIVFPVVIDDESDLTFGAVGEAFIRIIDGANDTEIARYTLPTTYTDEKSMDFGQLKRTGAEWVFEAMGDGRPTGLQGVKETYRIS